MSNKKMSNKKNVFFEEIELSEIVLKKTNQAFEMIHQKETGSMKKLNTKSKKSFKTQAAAIVGVCIVAVSGISAAAAIHHYWGRGMNGIFRHPMNSSRSLQKRISQKCTVRKQRMYPLL